jgi:hypothetical protein
MTSSRGLPIDPEGASQVHYKLELLYYPSVTTPSLLMFFIHGIDIWHVCRCGGG